MENKRQPEHDTIEQYEQEIRRLHEQVAERNWLRAKQLWKDAGEPCVGAEWASLVTFADELRYRAGIRAGYDVPADSHAYQPL